MTLPCEYMYGGVLRKRGELHQYKLDGIDGTEVIEESDAVMMPCEYGGVSALWKR